jgi:hypothetical protein
MCAVRGRALQMGGEALDMGWLKAFGQKIRNDKRNALRS